MTKDLALGLDLSYWSGGPPHGAAEAVMEAERLGFRSVWAAESYGSDSLTPLAWWGSLTSRLALGTAVVQLSARAPVATAMAAMTMDHLSGGRFILGLGVSGPQVVEGWYGAPFDQPLGRVREYIEIVRAVVARSAPVTSTGVHYPLPLPGSLLGKPLKSNIRPLRPRIPIYLGAQGPKMISLAGELCDGWLPALFSPELDTYYQTALAEGFARRQGGAPKDFEIAAVVPVAVADTVEAAADELRPYFTLMFGGMGARSKNFHADVAIRMGFSDTVEQIQRLYAAGQVREAEAALPITLIEQLALIGPPAKIRDDLARWRESVVTTLLVKGDSRRLRAIAEIVYG